MLRMVCITTWKGLLKITFLPDVSQFVVIFVRLMRWNQSGLLCVVSPWVQVTDTNFGIVKNLTLAVISSPGFFFVWLPHPSTIQFSIL